MDQNPSPLHSLDDALVNLPPLPPSTAYFFRVPGELRKGNEHHFTPTTVSIGPFHAANSSLEAAGRLLKYRALNHMLQRTQITLPNLFQFVKGLEEEARLCYGETVDLSSDEFSEMILLDGCFILSLLTSDYQLPLDRVRRLLIQNIQKDLLVFENQLPLFVIENLFTHLYQYFSEWIGMTFRSLVLNFLKPIFPTPLVKLDEFTTLPFKHLLELVLLTLFPRQPTAPNRTFSNFRKRSISLLERYGISPVSREHNSAVIKFSASGRLEIQPLYVREFTTPLFKNFLALEMFSDAEPRSCFLSYLSFLDVLIDTDDDVELLVRGGVLKTTLNNKEALVSILSDLSSSMGFYTDEYFTFVYQDLEEYVGGCGPKLAYFMSGWNKVNALFLFLLSLIQTWNAMASSYSSSLR
ncbi:UPF0481 protein At3g47200-like [Actinidia eriantha]|uniref:UPF0481 protein At3g47200-like n=1 Tax=Actinidia eriantha TaxID=165200 RepID=UPI00258447B7|nr:UPF0481 protein At3g47200-like [Actinidia eriantha]